MAREEAIRQILVIGGGASGLLAAIMAARAGAKVTLIEHKEQLGKKLLSTGNGRCNLGNRNMTADCYYAGEKDFPWRVFETFGLEENQVFWEELGMVLRDKNGYLYPWAESAAAVVGVLCREVERLKIETVMGCHVTGCRQVRKKMARRAEMAEPARATGTVWKVETNQGMFLANCVILAAGSKAASVLGSDGSGYEIARELGHTIRPVLPALVQLRCQGTFFKAWSGVRAEAEVTLFVNGEKKAADCGEVQLTDYGISGIPVFQVSRFASIGLHEGKKVEVFLNFLSFLRKEKGEEEKKAWFLERIQRFSEKTAEEFAAGFLQKKLAAVLLRSSGIALDKKLKEVDAAQREKLFSVLTAFRLVVVQTNSYEQAQICTGGVEVREIDARTLESKKASGVYLVGELLDVDGICGGYNLQWAFSSGAVAGKAAAARVRAMESASGNESFQKRKNERL